jgi:hypothetical protein
VVHGDQRGRAGRVDGQARPPRVQDVGEPSGGHAQGAPGRRPGIDGGRIGTRELPVLGGRHPDEHPGGGARQGPGRDGGVVERLVDDLQQDPLLGVHHRRLARGDAEEVRVEPGDVVEIAAVRMRVGGREVGEVAPAVLRDAPDRVDALAQQPPVAVRAVHPAGQPAADPDDGDRLGGPARKSVARHRHRLSRPRASRGLGAAQPCHQGLTGGRLPQQRRRQLAARGPGQLTGQGDRVPRRHAEVGERPVHRDGLGRGAVPDGHPFGDQPAQRALVEGPHPAAPAAAAACPSYAPSR